MRFTSFTISICLAMAGCQSLETAARREEIDSTSESKTSAAIGGKQIAQTVPPAPAPVAIELAQHVELVPTPAPEPLPHEAHKPVQLGSPKLADFEQMALMSNPSVARAAALVQAARGNYIQVGLAPNPTVGYEGQQIGSGGRAEQDGVFVEQEIVRGGKRALNRQVAAQEWAQREQELAAQQQRVLTDVRIAYNDVLVAQLQENLYSELVRNANELVDYNERLLRGGERSRGDVIQVTIERERLLTGSRNASRRRFAAWQALATVVGQPEMPLQDIEDSPEELSQKLHWGIVLDRLLTNSPEISAAMANVDRARWALQRACVEKTPNVTVQALVNWRDEGIDGKADGGVTVALPLPLWNRNQGGILQAQGEVAAAERALDQLELDLHNRLAQVFERYANARDFAERYKSLLEDLTTEWLSLNQRLRGAGEASQLDVIQFQRTFAQTRLDYLDAVRELRRAEAEIEGLLLSNSLGTR